MVINMELILIAIASSTLAYIVSGTSALESYHKLLLKLLKKNSTLYTDPLMSRLDFWMKLGLKYPNSFFVSLGSCGVCMSVVASIVFGLLCGSFNVIVLLSISWFAVVFYCILKRAVDWANGK